MPPSSSVAVLRRRAAPWAVLDVLRRRRRGELRPAVYVVVALAGVVVGALSPLPWWSPPLVLLALTWSGPLVAGLRGGPSLRGDLLDAAQPSGALRRRDQQTAARFRSATLPLYAVAGWPGPRAVGGAGWSSDGVSRLELVFFEAGVDGPSVRVASWTDAADDVRAQLVNELAGRSGGPRPDLSTEELFAEIDARHDALAARPWEPLRLTVDGHDRDAEVLRSGDGWAAVVHDDAAVVTVTGDSVRLDGLALERVHDVEPYVDGLRQLRAG